MYSRQHVGKENMEMRLISSRGTDRGAVARFGASNGDFTAILQVTLFSIL